MDKQWDDYYIEEQDADYEEEYEDWIDEEWDDYTDEERYEMQSRRIEREEWLEEQK